MPGAYEVSAWVRTEGLVGAGPGIVFDGRACYPGITGTTGWQRLAFVTRLPGARPAVSFALHHSGGTVRFDDFQIRPVGADPAGAPTPERRIEDVAGASAELSLHFDARRAALDRAGTVLDRAGHGHHGTLVGARWTGEAGARRVQLDGGAHVLVRGHPLLDLGEQASLALWVRPGTQREVPAQLPAEGGSRFLFELPAAG